MSAVRIASWAFVGLFTLAFSGWYLASDNALPRLDAKTLSNMVDVTVENFDMKQFNEHGELMHHLTSPKAKHVPKDDTYILNTPHLIVRDKKKEMWTIDAVMASIIEHGETITLKQDVNIQQISADGLLIKTNQITYQPKSQLVKTNSPITFKEPGKTIKANGMKANLGEQHVHLYGQTKGYYDPAVA